MLGKNPSLLEDEFAERPARVDEAGDGSNAHDGVLPIYFGTSAE
jgi:hypothetical protein